MTKSLMERNIAMPWTVNDVERHTKQADTASLKALWVKVANATLKKTKDEASAIKSADAVVKKVHEEHKGG